MKKVFIAGLLSVFAAASFGCSTNADSSANKSNVSSVNTNAEAAAANISNANSQPPLPAEVPVFTDAKEALEIGKKYFENNQDEKAINAFEQAIKLDPNLGEAHFHLGVAYQLNEKAGDEEAPAPSPAKSSKSKKAAAKPPEKPSEKEFRAAIKAYEAYLKKNPKDAAAQYYLGLSYQKVFEDDDARKALQEAVKLEPEDSDYQYELGMVLIKLAKYDEAVAALKKSLQIDPDNSRAEEALEKAQSGKKRIDAAKAELKSKIEEEQQQERPTRRKSSATPNTNADNPAEPPKETAPVNKNSNSQ